MRILLALVLVAAPIAGCLGPAAPSADGPASAADDLEVVSRTPGQGAHAALARIPFELPVALPLVGDIGASEPSIAGLPDGTLFVVALPRTSSASPNAVEGAAYLWRSGDGGANWESLRAPDPGTVGDGVFFSADADVTTSADGWVYYSDWWAGNFLVERSGDGGETWSSSPATTREAVPFTRVDRQWLVAGGDGFVGLFYSYFAAESPALPLPLTEATTGIHAVFSTDRGMTWSQPVLVATREPGHHTQIAKPRVMPDGTLVMPFGDTTWEDGSRWGPSLVKLAVSSDGGATWAHHLVADAPGLGFDHLWAVQADVTPDGAIHVAWGARTNDEEMVVFVATSRDLGRTWTEPLALRSTGLNFMPWVAAAGDGRVTVAWYGGDARGNPEEATEDAEWFAYAAESHDGGDTFVVQPVSPEPVKKGPMCVWGGGCGELLDYLGVVYDTDGALHVAFARLEKGPVEIRVVSAGSGP